MAVQQGHEERARALLRYLKPDTRYGEAVLPRPFMIEVTGSPSAGKTTIITKLDTVFNRADFRVMPAQEGAREIRHITRDTPLYNIRTATYALNKLIDYAWGHQYDLVIFDRCMFDHAIWQRYWLKRGKVTEEERHFYQSFFLSRFWIDYLDAAYLVTCDADVAMRREYGDGSLTQTPGNVTNPGTIAELAGYTREIYDELGDRYRQLKLVDTTHMSMSEMTDYVADHLLDSLHQKMLARTA